MAGDWIKMRGALIDHPKVIHVARSLLRTAEFRGWMIPGGSGPMNGQIISDQALRCVTTALLMRVWSLAREHGKFLGHDLVLDHSEIDDLDQMAGAPGVGRAMMEVGWATPENGVTLRNFKEFNVPMTSAEKQKSYRERNAFGNDVVTDPLPFRGNEISDSVTTREEKRRSTTTPLVPTLFERFWAVYPRKVAKAKALQSWVKIAPDEGLTGKILAAVERARATEQWRKDDGEFIPHPATWLNQRRWEDEVKASARKGFPL